MEVEGEVCKARPRHERDVPLLVMFQAPLYKTLRSGCTSISLPLLPKLPGPFEYLNWI